MEAICNTVQFKFPVGAPQPSWEEIADFTKRLHSDLLQIEAVYRLPGRCLCIKYTTERAMENTLERQEELIKFNYSNGKTADVRLSIAGRNSTYVRVFDIAPEVPDTDLTLVFGEYGKVESVIREKFPIGLGLDHLYTGIRGVYVEIEKEIPPSLQISGWKARIFYEGLKDKCFLCCLEGHHKDACPQRKTKKTRNKKKEGAVTYAGVVESGASALSDEVQVIEEESIDEDVIEETMDTEAIIREIEMRRKEQEAEMERQREERVMTGIAKLTNAFQSAMDRHEANERRNRVHVSTNPTHPTVLLFYFLLTVDFACFTDTMQYM